MNKKIMIANDHTILGLWKFILNSKNYPLSPLGWQSFVIHEVDSENIEIRLEDGSLRCISYQQFETEIEKMLRTEIVSTAYGFGYIIETLKRNRIIRFSDAFDHELTTSIEHFNPLFHNNARFSLRYDDRNFNVGDVIIFREWDGVSAEYTGREAKATVSHIESVAGLISDVDDTNWVILGLRNITKLPKVPEQFR